jgi:transposase
MPADATPIGSIAGLVEDPEQGGVVFVSGLAMFQFNPDDELARRLAAVQLVNTEIARPSEVAAGFGVTRDTLWRWRGSLEAPGVAGLVPGKRGPKGASKLTGEVVTRIRELDAHGLTLAAIGARVGVSATTVQVGLGPRAGSAGEARKAAATSADVDDVDDRQAHNTGNGLPGTGARHADAGDDAAGVQAGLAVLPAPLGPSTEINRPRS